MKSYGDWTPLEEIGRGGQGTVHRATKCKPERLVGAVRALAASAWRYGGGNQYEGNEPESLVSALDAHLAADDPQNLGALKVLHAIAEATERDQARQRLAHEREVLAKIRHASIVRLLDADVGGDWLVMEWLPCGSLDRALEVTAGNSFATLQRIRPIIDALAQLHQQSPIVVHRDIKPANIMLRANGNLVLGDMGIVWFADPGKASRCTTTLESVGSRHWMPPWAEGTRLDEVTPAFDVYSLGKLLWCMASGKPLLRREWWNDPKYDLTHQYPKDSGMLLINEILRVTVAEAEKDVLPDASKLLARVDEALAQLNGSVTIMNGSLHGNCQVCGHGEYTLAAQDAADLRNWGIAFAGTPRLAIFECGHCGHTLLFTRKALSGRMRPAWQSSDAGQ